MVDARNLPPAIQWYEGMMLAPQHFQQLSRRQEELLHYHISAISPFHWGVQRLKIDQALLIEGIFRVSELEALMPDGLIVSRMPEDEGLLEYDLSDLIDDIKLAPLTVHLAVPAKRGSKGPSKGAIPRYRSVEGESVMDENTGESEVSIPRLLPRLSLLVGEHPPSKYDTFPIAQVVYKDETLSLNNYIPPVLKLSPDTALWGICQGAARRLREKAIYLSEKIKAPSSAVKEPMKLQTKILVGSMVASLTRFEATFNTGQSHPYAVYLEFCSLVGNMASLSGGMVPPVLPTYDHNHLRMSYEEALGYMYRVLEEAVIESHTGIPFDKVRENVFSLRLEDEWLTQSLTVGLRGRPGVSESVLEEWMSESLIGSASISDAMSDKRILGAKRKRIDSDGSLIPLKGVALFSIEAVPTGSTELFIRPGEVLKIFNSSGAPKEESPVEIILYIKNPNT